MPSHFYYQVLATLLAQVISKAGDYAAWKEPLITALIYDYQLTEEVGAQLNCIVQGEGEEFSLESTLSKIVLFTDAEQQQILITLLVFIHSFLGFSPAMEQVLHLFLEKTGFSPSKYLAYRQRLQEDRAIFRSPNASAVNLAQLLSPELHNLVSSLRFLKDFKKL
jgi:hypothetical protein